MAEEEEKRDSFLEKLEAAEVKDEIRMGTPRATPAAEGATPRAEGAKDGKKEVKKKVK